jgi:hypothetical protein
MLGAKGYSIATMNNTTAAKVRTRRCMEALMAEV